MTATDSDDADLDAWTRSVQVTRDIVFFFHQQAGYSFVMDDLDYGFFSEEYWAALVDRRAPLDLEIQRGCLALLYAMGTYEAGNIGVALGEALQGCRCTLQLYQPTDRDTMALKALAEQALSHAAVPNSRRDFDAVWELSGKAAWIHQLAVRPYFESRARSGAAGR